MSTVESAKASCALTSASPPWRAALLPPVADAEPLAPADVAVAENPMGAVADWVCVAAELAEDALHPDARVSHESEKEEGTKEQ